MENADEGKVLKKEETLSLPPLQINVQTSSDLPLTVGRVEAETKHISQRLIQIEDSLKEISSRLEGIESLFNALELLPKIGPAIKNIRSARIKR
jgi:hypothetical protein